MSTEKLTCFSCEEDIAHSKNIAQFGKDWHENCFKCGTCEKTLDLKNFHEENKTPYCPDGDCKGLAGGKNVQINLIPLESPDKQEFFIPCARCERVKFI